MTISSRRHFIQQALSMGWLAVGVGYLPELITFDKRENLPSWTELIDYARWSPTVHNLQPHKLKVVSPSQAELYYDSSRLLPVTDPGAIFVTVAMGIFIETLSIAGAAYGQRIKIKRLFEPISTKKTGLIKFAELEMTPMTEPEEIDRELIKKRKTSRLHYDGRPLASSTLSLLDSCASKAGHTLSTSSEKKFVDEIIALNQATLFEDLDADASREELDRLFRYSQRQAEQTSDGLWSKCMCFPGRLIRSVFREHEKWDHGVQKKVLGGYYRNSFKGTQTICWFSGKFDNTTDWIAAGRMLARNWLLLTKDGACLHPFGSLITNEGAYRRINELISPPANGERVWMIFRAGYSKEPTRSFRLSTEEIIINNT